MNIRETFSEAETPLIVGLGGTNRSGSSSERALETCMSSIKRNGARVEVFLGSALDLPTYSPNTSIRSPEASALIDALRRCDGVVICSPSYHGAISGMIKNALDYTEDLRGDAECYLDQLPIGLIACGGGWQGAANAMTSLRSIAHSLRGWPTPLGAVLNTSTALFDGNGNCLDPSVEEQLSLVGKQVVSFAKLKCVIA